MRKQIIPNKERAFGLYSLALLRIKECEQLRGEVISFSKIFESLCRQFSIKKSDAWELLFILRDFGFIDIVKFHGVIFKNGK
jgi:hypothetical protein